MWGRGVPRSILPRGEDRNTAVTVSPPTLAVNPRFNFAWPTASVGAR